jgi:serine/threonine protein kinase
VSVFLFAVVGCWLHSTDVWALGCCLYSLAFFQNCFEEGSNLAILSRNYKIPDDNPYGPGLAELIDRMLTTDYKARCNMTEVILCLSALYSGNELPPRKERLSSKKTEGKKEANKVGTYRTDGQGIRTAPIVEPKKKISEVSHNNLTVAVCILPSLSVQWWLVDTK